MEPESFDLFIKRELEVEIVFHKAGRQVKIVLTPEEVRILTDALISSAQQSQVFIRASETRVPFFM